MPGELLGWRVRGNVAAQDSGHYESKWLAISDCTGKMTL